MTWILNSHSLNWLHSMHNAFMSIRGCKGTSKEQCGSNGAGDPRETKHTSSQGKRKEKKTIAVAEAESYAAFRDENYVSLWMVFWDRHGHVMEEARRRPRDRLAMGGGNWETLFTDCDLEATSKGEHSEREKWEPAARQSIERSGLYRLNWRCFFFLLGDDMKQRGFQKAQKDVGAWAVLHVWDSWCAKPCGSLSPLPPLVGLWWLTGVGLEGKEVAAAELRGLAQQQRMSDLGSQHCPTRFHPLPAATLSTQGIRKANPTVLCNARWIDVV